MRTSTRKITKYLKMRGIKTVLKECGNNIRSFNAHLRRECQLDKTTKLYEIDKEVKNVLSNNLDDYGAVVLAVKKLLQMNFGGIE